MERDMTMMVLGAGVFFALAIALREVQLARERALSMAVQEQLRLGLDGARMHLRRLAEDLFVLHRILVERQLIEDGDMGRGRRRLIDAPRRQAEERDAIQRHLGGTDAVTHVVIDEGGGKLH